MGYFIYMFHMANKHIWAGIRKYFFEKSLVSSILHYKEKTHNKGDDSDSKVHEANMGPIWGRQDPGGPHGGPMNFAICGGILESISVYWYIVSRFEFHVDLEVNVNPKCWGILYQTRLLDDL